MKLLTVSLSLIAIGTASAAVTRVTMWFALQRQILDVPNARSSHSQPTPRGGGSSIAFLFLAAVAVLGWYHLLSPVEAVGLLVGAAIVLIGALDDVLNLPILVRFPVQVLACAVAVVSLINCTVVRDTFGSTLLAAAVCIAVTILLVWLVNLTNFMDGIDGLAGVETVTVATLCFSITAATHGLSSIALLFSILAAASSGFLVWNWYPARIFMGDVGSGFIGFSLGALTLLATAKHVLSIFVPVILLGVFVVDASLTLVVRMARGERWYLPHRSHAYQHLARNIGHKRTTLLVGAVNIFWLGPLAAVAQLHPQLGPLYLAIAWTPLVAVTGWLGAGLPEGKWVTPHIGLPLATPRVIGTAARRAAGTIIRIYQLVGSYQAAVKHIVLALLNFGSVYLAAFTRFDGSMPAYWSSRLPEVALTWCIAQEAILLLFRAGRSRWRFTSAEEIPSVAAVAVLASATGGLAAAMPLFLDESHHHAIPHSIYLLDAVFSVAVLCGVRLASRNLFGLAHQWARVRNRRRVLIYGADATGVSILSELRRHCLDYHAIGFIDDEPEMKNGTLSGLPVLGTHTELVRLVQKLRIDVLLVPSGCDAWERTLREICMRQKLEFRMVPVLSDEIAQKRPRLSPELVIEDLLGRKPVQLDTTQIASSIQGKVVMVTGAAGSIGSELCRQIAGFRPRAIVGYEIGETALFYMERQMAELFPDVSFIPCIGSVQNRARLDDVLITYRPETVYHAAAYKHVPLMEQHIFEAIENNVFGTETLLRACDCHDVRSFVMISTDKAARPTSLMGASKRVAEMLVRASRSATLTCVSTRFGNVLGSNGSVIPIFRDQIARGGPIKVTHPGMVRFFMTIPEAAQLVLQASSLGAANEIFVLDMGEPVKIIDLAERMIRLAGMIPGRDIEIQFTGMRPGEKLVEELSTPDEELLPTAHQSISVFRSGATLSHLELQAELRQLRRAVEERSADGVLDILRRIVADYTPSHEIHTSIADQTPIPAHTLMAAPTLIAAPIDGAGQTLSVA